MNNVIAGIDEAGRGCLAGPVTAGACVLPDDCVLPGLTDSKKLTPENRAVLYDAVRARASAWAVGLAWPAEIDRINILQATFAAMGRAAGRMKRFPTHLVVDGNKTIPAPYLAALPAQPEQEAVVGGDLTVPAISAASILAKVFRDRLMAGLDARYPGYGFAAHKGYGVKAHLEALRELGPCRMHRLTFRGVLPEEERLARKGGVQGMLPGL